MLQNTVDSCLSQAGIKPEALTAVAATVGPGLSLCLQVSTSRSVSQTDLPTISSQIAASILSCLIELTNEL
jgi:tRNA A37 threonylcarbamoyltransferase TsaD